ncbi:hypothetical protein [Neisseria meningitidis]|nr:hypothetical protein [Neisseria meningitidis]
MPSETANGIQTASSSTVIPAQAGIQTVIPAQAGIQNLEQQQYSKII